MLCTPFRQEVELQEVEHRAGYTTLRVRIREGKRFTIFEIDARTAAEWGRHLLEWAARRPHDGEHREGDFSSGAEPSVG